ncbi:MAG TPA: hypothetical protein V6D05_16955 [Stenomitos sp.]
MIERKLEEVQELSLEEATQVKGGFGFVSWLAGKGRGGGDNLATEAYLS